MTRPTIRSCGAVFVSTVVAVGSIIAGAPVFAVGFDYGLDELRVTGNLEFLDDFEDGSRTTPPTSAFVDYRSTVTVEGDGLLILDSDNGSFPRPDLGVNLEWIEGLVDLTPPIVDGGSGTTRISASFRPDVPPEGFDGRMNSHYGIVLGTEGFQSVEIGIGNVLGFPNVFFYDNRIFADPTTGGSLGQDYVFPLSSITGNIVLELVIDHASDSVLPRYSVDGGATFVEGADWIYAARPGPVFDTGNEAFVSFFAFGEVPEPGTLCLLGGGLAGLSAYGRRRHWWIATVTPPQPRGTGRLRGLEPVLLLPPLLWGNARLRRMTGREPGPV